MTDYSDFPPLDCKEEPLSPAETQSEQWESAKQAAASVFCAIEKQAAVLHGLALETRAFDDKDARRLANEIAGAARELEAAAGNLRWMFDDTGHVAPWEV